MLATTKAIRVVNQLRDEGVITKYAVGGAVGAVFYIEPTQTQDIDIFIYLEVEQGSLLISTNRITDRLKELGYTLWKEDKLIVENWPIQFLPATKPVERDAVENAIEKPLAEGVKAFVPPPEYLMLIAIDLRRPKDIMRLYQFHSEQVYDPNKLKALLEKHRLTEQWEKILSLFKLQEAAYGFGSERIEKGK
jgi:hypothetical protein